MERTMTSSLQRETVGNGSNPQIAAESLEYAISQNSFAKDVDLINTDMVY